MLSNDIENNLLVSITNNYENTLIDTKCKEKIDEIDSVFNDFIKLTFDNLTFNSKELLTEAQLDIFSSLHNALSGFYRQAYNSLRSSLELVMFSIYFKDRDYEYFLWEKSGGKGEDARWGNTFNELIKKTILDYNKIDINYNDYEKTLNDINKLYGQLSNYTHGKPSHLQTRNIKVEYDKGEFLKFLGKLTETIENINYLCNIYFEGEIDENE